MEEDEREEEVMSCRQILHSQMMMDPRTRRATTYVFFYVSETKKTKTHTYKTNQCVASMLENLFHESSSDNEEEEIFNDENNQDKENDPEKENVVVQYSGHARAKSLIERFNKRKEVRPKIIHSISQTSHSKDTEFNDVREYVRNLTSGNIEENQRKRMGTIAYELIESTGTSYWLV